MFGYELHGGKKHYAFYVNNTNDHQHVSFDRALFAKSWRVYKLSTNISLQIFKITDLQLVLTVLGLLIGNIVSRN
jgi:hypothetical protein